MRAHPLVILALAALLMAGCGDTDPSGPTSEATEAAMNIDEGQAHYQDLIEKIRSTGQCAGQPLAWQEIEPESVEGAASDDEGNYTAYIYRGPFLGSDLKCHGEDFTSTVKEITAVLEADGGVADDVVLNNDDDYAQGGEVKWRDADGATFTFSSGVKTSFSMVSGKLPAP